jgi:hypothetical protein
MQRMLVPLRSLHRRSRRSRCSARPARWSSRWRVKLSHCLVPIANRTSLRRPSLLQCLEHRAKRPLRRPLFSVSLRPPPVRIPLDSKRRQASPLARRNRPRRSSQASRCSAPTQLQAAPPLKTRLPALCLRPQIRPRLQREETEKNLLQRRHFLPSRPPCRLILLVGILMLLAIPRLLPTYLRAPWMTHPSPRTSCLWRSLHRAMLRFLLTS